MKHIAIGLMSLLIAGSTSAANSPKEPTQKDVRYGEHERQVLDLYQARSEKPTAVVIYFHGGGFRVGDKGQVSDTILDTRRPAVGLHMGNPG